MNLVVSMNKRSCSPSAYNSKLTTTKFCSQFICQSLLLRQCIYFNLFFNLRCSIFKQLLQGQICSDQVLDPMLGHNNQGWQFKVLNYFNCVCIYTFNQCSNARFQLLLVIVKLVSKCRGNLYVNFLHDSFQFLPKILIFILDSIILTHDSYIVLSALGKQNFKLVYLLLLLLSHAQ